MAKRLFDLPETKGEFKARGLVTGTGKDKFYQTGKTASRKGADGKEIGLKDKRSIRFGLKVAADGSSVYCDILALEKDKVYFYKKGDKKAGIKGVSQPVNFSTRNSFNQEGFEPIGIKVGLEQEVSDKGQLKNINIPLFEFDAVEYLAKNLVENQAVFARGKMEFSSYIDGSTGNKVRMQKLVPGQISGVTTDLNLETDDYTPTNEFIQTIVFMGAELDNSDKNDVKGVISAKVVNYSTIEDIELIVRDKKLFQTMKKNLKPYNAIQVFGKINNRLEIEEVEDDGWGSANNPFEQKSNSFTKELLILGANPSTLDKDTYTKENMDEAIELIRASQKAKEDFGAKKENSDDSWGTETSNSTKQEEEDFDEDWG